MSSSGSIVKCADGAWVVQMIKGMLNTLRIILASFWCHFGVILVKDATRSGGDETGQEGVILASQWGCITRKSIIM